jgi:hypothetical protein
MAYERETKQELEVDFSLEDIWRAIPKALAELDWEIQEKNDKEHYFIVKTNKSALSYSSMLYIQASRKDEKTTNIKIDGETPVTTITSIMDFGQADERINIFVLTLAKIMNTPAQQA